MYNSKLYAILEHFDKYEQNRCRKYIQSPYFNPSEELATLYELFIEAINQQAPSKLEKEALWEAIQPKRAFDDVRFRKYCSDLLKLIEGFMAQTTYETKQLQQATYLMEAVAKKKVPALYSTAMRTARRLSEKQPYRSAEYYYHQYSIEQNYYNLTEFETKRSNRTNIEDIANNLDIFYLAEKLRILCAAITQQTFVSHDYELLFIKDIIRHLENFDAEKYPPIAVYYQIYLTLTDTEDESHYFKLKKLLERYGLLFPPSEARDILYISAQNYCIRKINLGHLKFMEELFQLYLDLLDKGILTAEGELSPWYFKNIVVIALRLGKYDWTEKFIKDYQDSLPESSRENAVTYNLAQVYFYQKRHEEVIKLLQTVEYDDVAYNLGSKSMLLATYYETDEIEPLYSLFESFRAFLNRHKDIPAERRESYLNLIKFTKKLTRIVPGEKRELTKIRDDAERVKNIASFNWLQEKIAELE